MDFEQLNETIIEELKCSGKKKSYYCCFKEISSQELFDGLLGYGLFADKIPPFLTAENFLGFCRLSKNTSSFLDEPKKYIHYESMRNINVPRVLAIPEPSVYYRQCKVLSDNWEELLKYFHEKTKSHTHKVSRIHIRKIDDAFEIFSNCYDDEDIDLDEYANSSQNHLFEMNHKNFYKDDFPEPQLLIGKQYIVKADISNCFPSIYTHSLPWALVGKKEAKTKSKPEHNSEWFNQIDVATRRIKENETHGILIGSHSSNLVSEIVLTAIDEKMWEKGYRYIRNIDDYTCYVETQEITEKFLIDLSHELKQYGLMLNHKKTETSKLPKASLESWVRKLNSFVFPSEKTEKLKLPVVRAYLDIALDLMFHNKENSAILNYAIRVISQKELTNGAKEYLLNTIHHLMLLYPYLIPIIDKNFFEPFKIREERIKRIAVDIFELGQSKKLHEAMSYALFLSLKYGFKLIEDLFDKVKCSNDTVLLLLAYLHDEKFINHSAVRKQYKQLAKSYMDDIDEYWLFVYEVLTQGHLKGHWKVMKKENITFIKNEFIMEEK